MTIELASVEPVSKPRQSALSYIANAIPKLVFKDVMTFVRGTSETDTDVETLVARAELLLKWCESFDQEQ